jgi:hypothetical protein
LKLLEIKSFRKDTGHCWIARLPDGIASGDSAGRPPSSLLRLFESDRELGPGRVTHDWVREQGCGAFSHWGTDLFFSTSDNTFPGRNGRKYFVVAPAQDEAGAESLQGFGSPVPGDAVDYGLLELTPQQAHEAAQYALRVAQSYVERLPGGRGWLAGRTVLELGPGTSFASALVLAC